MRITFEMSGGPYDGQSVSTNLTDPDRAHGWYWTSNNGKVGQRFQSAPLRALASMQTIGDAKEDGFKAHYYKVTSRTENGEEVYVRAEYDSNQEPLSTI